MPISRKREIYGRRFKMIVLKVFLVLGLIFALFQLISPGRWKPLLVIWGVIGIIGGIAFIAIS